MESRIRNVTDNHLSSSSKGMDGQTNTDNTCPTIMSTATIHIRDVLNAMIQNAEALKRLLLTHEDVMVDADRTAYLQELLDEIAAREVRHTGRLNELLLKAHLERR